MRILIREKNFIFGLLSVTQTFFDNTVVYKYLQWKYLYDLIVHECCSENICKIPILNLKSFLQFIEVTSLEFLIFLTRVKNIKNSREVTSINCRKLFKFKMGILQIFSLQHSCTIRSYRYFHCKYL